MTTGEALDKIRDIAEQPIDGDEDLEVKALADIYWIVASWHNEMSAKNGRWL